MTSYIWYRGEGKGMSKVGYYEDNQDRTMSQKPKTERVLGRVGGTDQYCQTLQAQHGGYSICPLDENSFNKILKRQKPDCGGVKNNWLLREFRKLNFVSEGNKRSQWRQTTHMEVIMVKKNCWNVEILVSMQVEAKSQWNREKLRMWTRSERRQEGMGSESEVKELP